MGNNSCNPQTLLLEEKVHLLWVRTQGEKDLLYINLILPDQAYKHQLYKQNTKFKF